MAENLIEEFKPEIREALFDVAEEVLQTKECKIRIEPGSKKGNVHNGNDWIAHFLGFLSRRQFSWHCISCNVQHRRWE